MVRFVVDGQDVLHAHEVGHHALKHLAFSFLRVEVITRAALKQGAASRGKFDAFAKLEGVVVGDDDLGPIHIVEHVAGNKLTAGVVAIRIVGLEHAQAVFDRQAGRADQKAAREMFAGRSAQRH
jgi:hypothetical protein